LSNYDELLEEARTKAEAFRSSAKEYIPKMYEALRRENPNISPEDARDRIEKDCVGIWSKSTILHALPDEAKNKEKQKAGRLGQKERNSAAFSAAPSPQQVEEKTKIIVAAVQGKSVEEDMPRASDLSSTNNSSLSEDSTANSNSIQAHLQHHKAISNLKECSSCQELQAKVNELTDTLRKTTQLKTADQINKPSSSSDSGSQLENSSSNVSYFEFSLPLEDVRKYIINSFNVHKIKDQIWFSGTIDKSTGKIITATTGRKPQQSTIEENNKDHSSSNDSSYYRIHH
jgi:hypothetical protein